MTNIDVHDLPEPMARAIAETVETLRQRLQKKKEGRAHFSLPNWSLGVKGKLTREEIYDYLDDRF